MPKIPDTRILFAGGGSGGHVYPLIAVAEALIARATKNGMLISLHYLGPADDYRELIENQGIHFHHLTGAKLRRYATFSNILDIPKFFIGFLWALVKLYALMPDVVLSKGGPGALAVIYAASFYRIPIIAHESDAVSSLTTRLSAKRARRIGVSFAQVASALGEKKSFLTGGVVRESLRRGDIPQEEAKMKLGFDPEKPLMLVLGGSQGSERINTFIISNLGVILRETQVLHQTGVRGYDAVRAVTNPLLAGAGKDFMAYRTEPYFVQNYATALAAADCVVTRAGSGTLFEIASFQKPMLIIPLPESAQNHQQENARVFRASGAARVVEEVNLTQGIFMTELRVILLDESVRTTMQNAAASFPVVGAARITEEILAIVG